MTQKTGALIFDETADRYDIRFDVNDYYFLLISYCMQSFSRQRTKSVVPSAARSLYQNRTASNTARTAGSGLPADRQPSA